MTEEKIPEVMEFVREQIKERGVLLSLYEKDYELDDEWLYLTVTPAQTGIRASDYAKQMSDIEKELRAHHYDHVLLVPTIED